MSDAQTTASTTRQAGAPKTESHQPLREMADGGAAQARKSFENMSASTAEASDLIQNACSTAAQSAMGYNAKVVEIARVNTNAALDYADQLLGVKSPSEFFELSATHARKQLEVLSEQTKELTALGQKIMQETAEPLKAGATKAFRGPFG
jgi:phasin